MRDVMIDLETLSTRPDAMIISIGAVAFGPDGVGPEFHAVIEPDSAVGHVDAATVYWWMGQGEEARAPFNLDPRGGKRDSLTIALKRLVWMIGDLPPTPGGLRVWGHGSSFDLPIIESAFRACGVECPWQHRAPRDTRTILELADVSVVMPEGAKHNALWDARAQALAVIKAAHILGARRLWPEIPTAKPRDVVLHTGIPLPTANGVKAAAIQFHGGDHGAR